MIACCSQAQKLAVNHDRVRLQLTDDPNGLISTPLLRPRPRGREVEPEDVERSITGTQFSHLTMQKLPKGLQIWHIIRGDTPHRVLTVVMVREVRS